MRSVFFACVCSVIGASSGSASAQLTEEMILEGITVRDGYEVTAAVSDLPGIRFLEFGDRGELYASIPSAGRIMSLWDKDGDGSFEEREIYLNNRTSPGVHGMHFFKGWLWYTTSTSVWKSRDTDGDGVSDENVKVIDGLPGGTGHWWRPIFVTDSHFYTGVGDSGNIKDETDTERQKLFRFNLDGSGKRLFARGIRNTEKLRFRPGTEELWGCDHGSDNFGAELGERFPSNIPVTDYYPPDELNKYEDGGFYGHPFIVGKRVPRIEWQDKEDILELAQQTIVPAWEFEAHAATNGFAFLEESDAFPADHAGDMFVACHGSWNRSVPSGYSIVRVLFDDGTPYGMLTIVDGKRGQDKTGERGAFLRPVDCVQAPDGSMIFSFDHNVRDAPPGAFRIRWVGDGEKGEMDAADGDEGEE